MRWPTARHARLETRLRPTVRARGNGCTSTVPLARHQQKTREMCFLVRRRWWAPPPPDLSILLLARPPDRIDTNNNIQCRVPGFDVYSILCFQPLQMGWLPIEQQIISIEDGTPHSPLMPTMPGPASIRCAHNTVLDM